MCWRGMTLPVSRCSSPARIRGLGQETAPQAMAAKGAAVVMAGRERSGQRLDEAVAAIRAELPDAALETIHLRSRFRPKVSAPCGSLSTSERFDKIDLIINNAGVMAWPADAHR